jgi:hypothetical protein
MTRKVGIERNASGALDTMLNPMNTGVPIMRKKAELYKMTMIVFSRNRVRNDIGIVMRYSIRDEFPTVVALTMIDPMNENSIRTLNRVEPAPMFSVNIVSRISHPITGTIDTIIQIISIANRVAPMG